MSIKCAIFDLDGTLVDSLVDLTNSMNHGLQKLGMPTHQPSDCLKMIGHGKENFAKNALPQDKKHLTGQLVNLAWHHYCDNCCIDTKPYDGIIEMLNYYAEKGVKLAILTNKEQMVARKIADFCFPDHDFFDVIGEVNTIAPKPEPDELLKLIDRMGFDKTQTIMVGDSEADIKTGKNADVYTVAVTWGFRSKAQLENLNADILVDTPNGLFKLLD